ncbi:hypothetical protein Phi14:2_gp131 [Cellulophaga phage phi14:2]|uniref:Uncharacterized protein n=1 Tax=Cellulophaga phage phi14:2 TaxID=1327990 RepID=S0A0C2_9CAUD|nr:hypothetical protein Phi14:2_gp131 [Cellulophaga phage phi14:2]
MLFFTVCYSFYISTYSLRCQKQLILCSSKLSFYLRDVSCPLFFSLLSDYFYSYEEIS